MSVEMTPRTTTDAPQSTASRPAVNKFPLQVQAPRLNLLGVGVSALDLQDAVSHIVEAVAQGKGGYVCVCGVHGVIECRDDDELREIHNRALLVTPDGMPLVWALRRAGHAAVGRVYGPDLMLMLLQKGQALGLRHYLYGTTPAVLTDLRKGLLRQAPDARIVGTTAPPFRTLTADERATVAKDIRESGADIVWVGLSTPKQERWMAQMAAELAPAILIGVGAAFDFHAGRKSQAPLFLQERGLEWAYRLATEPRRLWRRYARIVPRYLALRAACRLGLQDRLCPTIDAKPLPLRRAR